MFMQYIVAKHDAMGHIQQENTYWKSGRYYNLRQIVLDCLQAVVEFVK